APAKALIARFATFAYTMTAPGCCARCRASARQPLPSSSWCAAKCWSAWFSPLGRDPTPSRADIEMTKQIGAAAKPVGVLVHDHIIVGKQGHASFRGLGLI